MQDPERDPKERTLIFVQTKKNADFLATYLSGEGLPTTSIHGDRCVLMLSIFCHNLCVGFKERGRKHCSTSAPATSQSWWRLPWLLEGLTSPMLPMSSTMTCPMMWTSTCTGSVSGSCALDLINGQGHALLSGRSGRVGNLGMKTSFVDPEGDGDVMPKLVDMLTKVFVQQFRVILVLLTLMVPCL